MVQCLLVEIQNKSSRPTFVQTILTFHCSLYKLTSLLFAYNKEAQTFCSGKPLTFLGLFLSIVNNRPHNNILLQWSCKYVITNMLLNSMMADYLTMGLNSASCCLLDKDFDNV